MKKTSIIALVIVALIAGGYFLLRNKGEENNGNKENNKTFNIQGMKIEILQEGAGAEAKNGDTVLAHYTGTLESGVKFDSSVDRGIPFSFELGAGRVIKGWDLGILGMKVGEKRKLTIPPELAYGSNAVG
ncbi:MAG: FKBP-type peptidyl-prolyl cis-trans isomerase, partial [Candidatus Omnitrophota bacterium]|nr:FKBP-type peptidyl-prolyl cis-trans isomerase [Candidatus Omnitrophota bacterium]